MAAALVFSAIATTGPIAVAQDKPPDELREERKQVKEKEVETQEEIEELLGDLDNLEIAFNNLVAAADSADEAVDAAIRKLSDAQAEQARTTTRIAELEAEIAETRLLLQQSAISAYTSFQGPNSEQTALSSDPWQQARSQSLRQFRQPQHRGSPRRVSRPSS